MIKQLCLLATVGLFSLPTFSQVSAPENLSNNQDKLKIVTTIFPEYDWVKQILGENIKNVDLTLLQDNKVDLHSYQPTAEDILKIKNSDLFIYVGGESDTWVSRALSDVKNKNQHVINLVKELGSKAKEESAVPGMQSEHHHDDEHHHDEHHDEEHEHHHSHNITAFSNTDVKDRSLSDFSGSWQSVFPLIKQGSLNEFFSYKEKTGNMSYKEYEDFYTKAYKSDIDKIKIADGSIIYTIDGSNIKAGYKYDGFYIRQSENGNKQVRYKFKKSSGDKKAPIFVVFSDHNIEPTKPEHFHIYVGNLGFESLVEESKNYPTFYDASLSGKQIADEMIAHSEVVYDEHVWLSLKNAKIFTNAIANALIELDQKHQQLYERNLKSYQRKIDDLDKEFHKIIDKASNHTLLFADRFPFRYLTDDYNLSYYAAFAGCSAETQASFKTITFLAQKADELKLKDIITIDGSDKKIAHAVIRNTDKRNQQILTLDSMQSTNTHDIASGISYLSIMKNNLKVLAEALNN